jgi:hypothetical protein
LRHRITFGKIPESIGMGNISVIADSECFHKYHDVLSISRFETIFEKIFVDVPEYAVDKLRTTGGYALLDVINNDTILKVTSRQDLFTSLFKVRKGYALHIVNVQDTISKEGKANHLLPIPAYVKGAKPIKHEIEVSVKMDMPVTKVTLYSPERRRSLNIPFRNDTSAFSNSLVFTVPAKVFSGYALIKIK